MEYLYFMSTNKFLIQGLVRIDCKSTYFEHLIDLNIDKYGLYSYSIPTYVDNVLYLNKINLIFQRVISEHGNTVTTLPSTWWSIKLVVPQLGGPPTWWSPNLVVPQLGHPSTWSLNLVPQLAVANSMFYTVNR